ncbi:hypothetical protein PLANPX_0318 [Lacipirellula parvula]|uniref:Uncharacterized protein n=1 Tax=Lacipirellula parvula TaxID=2650471 RepID=A0A5K7X8T3_9BACT|nr:hypothetical protein PLANPX_0318 [Lacipirellula parvula]
MEVSWLWFVVPALVMGCYVLPVLILCLSGLKLHLHKEAAAVELFRGLLSSGAIDPQWLRDSGFSPLGAYHLGDATGRSSVVWKRTGERTYLSVVLNGGEFSSLEFFSAFESGGLSTGSRILQVLPVAPGRWVQSFSLNDPREVWKRHLQGLEYLRNASGKEPSVSEVTILDEFQSILDDSFRYITSLRFWYLRTAYWPIVRPCWQHGKTVSEQAARRHDV